MIINFNIINITKGSIVGNVITRKEKAKRTTISI